MTSRGVTHINAYQLRTLMQELPEGDFLLVDVRETDEYEVEHISGARLIPLLLLESGVEEIPEVEHVVFYCRSGARSARAAAHAVARLGRRGVYNLAGGMQGWQGRTVAKRPAMRIFDTASSARDVLMQAMDLEKGAQRFYDAALRAVPGHPVARTFETLLHAETSHGRALYGQLAKAVGDPVPDFETLFAQLEGVIVEGGEPLDDLLARLATIDEVAIVELALEVELTGYDLYRSMADVPSMVGLRSVLLEMAEHERAHVKVLLAEVQRLGVQG